MKCKIKKELSEFYKNTSKKDGYATECKICARIQTIDHRKKNRGSRILEGIKQRCENSNSPAYKYYMGKGIQNFLTKEDIKFLLKRDNANLMKKPSIDRINHNGNYTLKNCRIIEMPINGGKAKVDCAKTCLQFTKDGKFVKEWKSVKLAEAGLNLVGIHMVCVGKRKTVGKFVWKYKTPNVTVISKPDLMPCWSCNSEGSTVINESHPLIRTLCPICLGSGTWVENHYIVIDEKNGIAIDSDSGG